MTRPKLLDLYCGQGAVPPAYTEFIGDRLKENDVFNGR